MELRQKRSDSKWESQLQAKGAKERLSSYQSEDAGHASRTSFTSVKDIKKLYLPDIHSRDSSRGDNQTQSPPGTKRSSQGTKPGELPSATLFKKGRKPPMIHREYQDRFVDKPSYVAHGQKLEFDTRMQPEMDFKMTKSNMRKRHTLFRFGPVQNEQSPKMSNKS